MNFKEIRLLNLKILILLLKLLIAILAIRSTPYVHRLQTFQRDFQQAHGHGDHAFRRIWLEVTQICIL